MKHRNSMGSSECYAIPSIASPTRGLSSLSFKPYMSSKWGETVIPCQYPSMDSWTAQYFQHLTANKNLKSNGDVTESLPKDPRLWSREDVATWVQLVVTAHSLPTVQLDRFLMNGKALCLMTIDMFVKRVPLGGKLLYKDFQLRLSSALYS